MDVNPYESPRSPLPDTASQKFAKRLLFFRDQPVSFVLFFHGQGRAVAFVVIYFVASIALCAWIELYPVMYVMIGMFIGRIAGGLGLARKYAVLWPLEKKIIDWERVVRMANGDTLDLGPPEFREVPRTVASTPT